MKEYLLNLFIALLITILVVFANWLNGDNGRIVSVVFCALVSAIITAAFEVVMKITGKMPNVNWRIYLTEAVICIGVSFLALVMV